MIEFLLSENKVRDVAQKDFLVIKTKIQIKTEENWKNYKNRTSICTFFLKTKLHRGRKKHLVYELSKEMCHIN